LRCGAVQDGYAGGIHPAVAFVLALVLDEDPDERDDGPALRSVPNRP
jgi:hypothetical protein